MKRKKTICNFLCAFIITLCISTNTTTVSAAGRGAFAGDSIGARPSVLGEAFVAVADDSNALRWNPSGIARLLQPEMTLSHINFFTLGGYLDYSSDSNAINEDFIGLVYPNQTAPIVVSFLTLSAPGMFHADEGGRSWMSALVTPSERLPPQWANSSKSKPSGSTLAGISIAFRSAIKAKALGLEWMADFCWRRQAFGLM